MNFKTASNFGLSQSCLILRRHEVLVVASELFGYFDFRFAPLMRYTGSLSQGVKNPDLHRMGKFDGWLTGCPIITDGVSLLETNPLC